MPLPRVTYTADTMNTSLQNVNLTEPGSVTMPPGASSFPGTTDEFKKLTYSAPNDATMRTKLAEYHSLMVKLTGGTGTQADLDRLNVLIGEIREYVLTEEDLNLMVDALNKIENYLYTYLKTDLAAKATAMDDVLEEFIATLNDFMTSLEAQYAKSPENYPIPMKSILFDKTEQRIQDSIVYNEGTLGVIVSATAPVKPVNRDIIWIDTNMSDAD